MLDSDSDIRLPILLYHHVGPSRSGTFLDLTVSPEKFRRQVGWMARSGYVGIRPSDWLGWCRAEKCLPAKPVLLTFDDAYADIAECALPVLREYGFGAAVYVVTSELGGTNSWDEARGSSTHRLLDVDQIVYWAALGFEFGAHSRTHPDLTTLARNEAEKEIAGSKNELERALGTRVLSFVYPYGSHNETVRKLARANFQLALTVKEGLNGRDTDLYALCRSPVRPEDSLFDLWLRLKFGLNPVEHLRRSLAISKRRVLAALAWQL